METQQAVSTKSSTGNNRIWMIAGGLLLLCCCGVVIMAGAAGVYYYTSTPSTVPVVNDIAPQPQWLVTADELNSFSEQELGIIQWELVEATPGQYQVCNTFTGVSWSANPNTAGNCIGQAATNSLDDVIDSLFEDGQMFSDEVPINASFSFDGQYALYGGTYTPTAHAIYDLFVLQDGMLYWASVTLGRPPGVSAAELYASNPQGINNFLERIIRINLERSH